MEAPDSQLEVSKSIFISKNNFIKNKLYILIANKYFDYLYVFNIIKNISNSCFRCQLYIIVNIYCVIGH